MNDNGMCSPDLSRCWQSGGKMPWRGWEYSLPCWHCSADSGGVFPSTLALCGQSPQARDASSAAGRADRIRCHAGTGRHSASPGIARFVGHQEGKHFNCKTALQVDTAALTVRRRSGEELYPYCRALDVQCLRLKHWTVGRERPGQQVILILACTPHCPACKQCTDIS